ncbi:MFS transporter [Streptomyces sp. NBC_01764]|uniref:MFS transporter n=1 Tax=Streptomyces sp. NBC_01764 TaxID=2975935 RepID=UPI00224FF0AC|nr:MFS transporter [Streptomyces sp. NBC_01764]MCX4411148.1 MFS transporter [Streptomyces sp. NBC_01764]
MTLLDQAEVPEETEKPPPLRRNKNFLLLWSGAGLSQCGVRAAVSAYPLLMLWYTGSPADAGLVGSAALLPQLLLLLPAGALVDRWDRRRLMVVCDAVGLVSMGSLAAALWFGVLSVPHVMAAAFLEGGAVIFYKLAERAAVRHLVHPDHLSAALSQNEARGQAAGLLGQPSAAVLFQAFRWLPFGGPRSPTSSRWSRCCSSPSRSRTSGTRRPDGRCGPRSARASPGCGDSASRGPRSSSSAAATCCSRSSIWPWC